MHSAVDDAAGEGGQSGGLNRAGLALGGLVFTAALVNPLAFISLIPVLPTITEHFADTPGAAALARGLVTVVSVALVFGAPLAGIAAERFGTRRILLTAIALFTLAGLSGALIDNLWLLIASRTVLGFADAFIGTLVIALISSRLAPAARDRWIGWYTAFGSIGALSILPFAGMIAQANWRYVFLLYGAGAIIFLCAVLSLRGQAHVPVRMVKTAAGSMIGARVIPLGLIALGIAAGAVENTTHLFLPFHLHAMGESIPSRIANGVLPIAVGGTISAFLYGYLRTRLSVGAVFVLAYLVGGVALLWIGFAETYGAILLAAGCLGLGVGMLAPNVNAYAAVYSDPSRRARNIGFTWGAFFAGAPIAQLLLEPISTAYGAGAAIGTLGIVSFILAGVGWLFLSRRRAVEAADAT